MLMLALLKLRDGGRRFLHSDETGDVPGWVMVTVMTAALVAALLAIAAPKLTDAFTPRDRLDHRVMMRRARDEAGASVVEFVLVGALLLFVAFGVLQVGLVLHARNVLAADAAEGARHAASLAVPVDSGASRRHGPGASAASPASRPA